MKFKKKQRFWGSPNWLTEFEKYYTGIFLFEPVCVFIFLP